MKIKVFLFAYVNHIGAFNLSALHLAEHLDKNKFEIYALKLGRGSLANKSLRNVKTFTCFYPAKISNYLGILWGIINSDVVFIMRGNHHRFVRWCIRFLNKKSFKRQGNKIDDSVLGSISSTVGGKSAIAASYNFCNKVYAPTFSIGRYNQERWGIKFDEQRCLPPFVNTSGFHWSARDRRSVKNVVFIGNDMIRKNIYTYLALAENLPNLTFYVVGNPPQPDFFDEATKNLIPVGSKTPEELNLFLDDMDLHCFTSRSEGFGKVTIEVAAKGIPSVLFDDYGAKEWLINGVEGQIVRTDQEYHQKVVELVENPKHYKTLVEGLPNLLRRFSMEAQLQQYEQVIREVYAS